MAILSAAPFEPRNPSFVDAEGPKLSFLKAADEIGSATLTPQSWAKCTSILFLTSSP